ncbi:MAG: type II toxin-antitoxin system Phd/YefM family antitoxin [Desulfobacteraceae bacterium]|nr:MAG: type II toxin-antitoxin system Phd/YefM family antitoxin [Desulfobacteraceae bacterium]
MQTMGISRFKSHALKILDQVAKTQEIIVITKRGKPLAQLIPYKNLILNHKPGKLANAFVFENDVVSPLDEEMWDSCK